MLIFRSDSYQYWGDKYHSVLSSHVLFSRFLDGGLIGPLWREDILGGIPWIISLSTSPFMVDNFAARFFQLSPFGLDLLSHLLAYGMTVAAMYLYVRMVLQFTQEGATIASILYAANGYVLSTWTGSANDFATTASLPALLVLAHQVKAAIAAGNKAASFMAVGGIALLVYFFGGMATIKTFPIFLLVFFAYCFMVFGMHRTIFHIAAGVAVGLLLYSPWLWFVWSAAVVSQRNVPGFMPSASFDLWAMVQQFLVILGKRSPWFGLYCLTVPVAAGVVCALADRPLAHESRMVKTILKYSVIAFAVCFALAGLAPQVNAAKSSVPLLGGFDVVRFELFAPFFAVIVVGMLLDRSMFQPHARRISTVHGSWLRAVLVIAGLLLSSQAVYMVSRITRLPSTIYPQNLLLILYVAVYAIIALWLLAVVYKSLRGWTEGLQRQSLVLVVLALVFPVSVWSARLGMDDSNRTAQDEPIMSYAERFSIPDDLVLLKALNTTNDRVVDLTRPYARVLTTYSGTALPWAGLRTPIGYSNLFPLWYHEFVTQGILGSRELPTRWVEIRAASQTNFDALKLLDVKFVLSDGSTSIPGYSRLMEHTPTGKVIYVAEPGVGQAFLSRGAQCVATDEEALTLIHAADYRSLVGRAILVAKDPAAATICGQASTSAGSSGANHEKLLVRRRLDGASVDVESVHGGVLTLADTYYPGWRAFVDGVEAPILRTYTTLRGVMVDAGRHRVEFIFSPATFRVLLWMSGSLLAILLGTVGVVYGVSLRAPNRQPMKSGT
jgi:hypothetical protein